MIEPPDHLVLTDQQARVLGVLMEKRATTPDVYPLTLRAVTTGCNQSTSRDPVVDYDDDTVGRTLDELKALGLVRMVHPGAGERSTKFRHVVDEALGLDAATSAVLCVLMLRGPQTAAELKARTERIHRFDATGSAEQALHALADHPRHLAEALERLPGHKERRWVQLLTIATPHTGATAPAAAPTDGPPPSGPVDDLADRMAAVEARLTRIERALGDLLADPPETGPTDDTPTTVSGPA